MPQAKPIMIQGTMSNAGKSLIAAGLCRILKQDGLRVAPFKSQNMALNSYITKEGFEMGRAQVVQAEAAGIPPHVNMNPILLKPTSDKGSQVIINGEVLGNLTAKEYFARKREFIPDILKAYRTLADQNDVIVVEGAGSPAEINLKREDIVNMGLAKLISAPVLLVGDIDPGGVFAQLAGTIQLLEPEERQLTKGMIINKFRGDVSLLQSGLDMIESITGKPVLGVVPYLQVDIEDEDSLSRRLTEKGMGGLVDIAVLRLPRISNFTDFDCFQRLPEVSLRYITRPEELHNPDLIILPGTKSTISDLLWLRQTGLEAAVLKAASRGTPVFGICGGYQMLGEQIADPEGIEGGGVIRGLGLLPVETVFSPQKTRTLQEGALAGLEGIFAPLSGMEVAGYEIHMGETRPTQAGVLPVAAFHPAFGTSGDPVFDGAQRGNAYGSYLHGIFDRDGAAQAVVDVLLTEKGLTPGSRTGVSLVEYKESQYNLLADTLRASLDMDAVYRILEQGI